MYFEKEISGGRAFMELEKVGDTFAIKRRGFVARYKAKGIQPYQPQLATESPLIHDGSQNTLSTATDFRNSTLTGTTLSGPNGSGQFLLVTPSTGTSRTMTLFTTTMQNLSTLNAVYGVCQNKPRGGDAIDVGIFGITKMVAGLATIVNGTILQASSTASGTVTPFLGGNGRPVGIALESAGTVGQVFTGFIGGAQIGAST